ncbi:hypothetical protein LzC2_23090 [Planctomycetes bacterium LzC2]|uniref:Glycosyltransferase n=1 Tax=Alienimonas chondri TaxID=2681879 RepID=A0ABX1VG39_9PLAN|nr:hypothetical protein [Alienimonas chondri]
MSGGTLLITASPPGGANVGQILVADMLAIAGADISVLYLRTGPPPGGVSEFAIKDVRVPAEQALRPSPGRWGTVVAAADRLTRYEPAVAQAANEVRSHLRDLQPDRVWVIASTTAVIDVAAAALSGVEGELLVQVWDDPVHLMRQRRLDRLTQRRTLRRFHALLVRADRVATIGEAMAEAYRSYTAAPIIVIRHGVRGEVEARSTPADPDEFRIGFAGALYATDAWIALQNSLDELGWEVGGRSAALVTAGSRAVFRAGGPGQSRFLGWRSTAEVHELLSGCDLLYLPQPFDGVQEPLARLSFPTKLSAYAATGRPVFVHAPPYASLPRFCREQRFGMVCESTSPAVVAAALRRFAEEPGLLAELAAGTARIGSTVLSRDQFGADVQSFLLPTAIATQDTARNSFNVDCALLPTTTGVT